MEPQGLAEEEALKSSRWNPEARRARALIVGFAAFVALVTALLWAFGTGGADVGKLASSGDRARRREAVKKLWGRTDQTARETLHRLSSDKDVRVAVTAVCALGRTGDEAQPLLEDILADTAKPARVRCEAAAELGRFGPEARERLCSALREEPDPVVRMGAAKGLWRLRDVNSATRLAGALSDPDRRVRTHVLKALNRMMIRRFPYDPELPPEQQQAVIGEIARYVTAGIPDSSTAPPAKQPCTPGQNAARHP